MSSKWNRIRRSKLIFYREGPDWVEKIRLYFSTLILNFAEKLPEAKKGFLSELQYLRRRQRERAEENFLGYQIPAGTRIEWLGFQLINLFHIEDLDSFLKTLAFLFPEKDKFSISRLNNYHGSLKSGGWQYQGVLKNEDSKYFFSPEATCKVKGLSNDIEYIELYSHKITPSLIGLSAFICIKSDSRKKLRKYFEKSYLFPTKIGRYHKRINFLPNSGTGFPNYGPKEEFIKWCESIQSNAEGIIRKLFNGYFDRDKRKRFPRIDIFLLQEKFRSKSDESERKKIEYWKNSLGFDVFIKYDDEQNGLQWLPKSDYPEQVWPTRLIIDPKKYLNKNQLNYGHSDEDSIWIDIKYKLLEIASSFSLVEYFYNERDKINYLRKEVFRAENTQMKRRLNKATKLLSEVQSNYIMLVRVLTEFGMDENSYKKAIDKFGASFILEYDNESLLSNDLKSDLDYFKGLLSNYSNFIENVTNNMVNVANLRSTSRIAVTSLLIAVISLFISLLELKIDLEGIKEFFYQLLNIIQ